MNLNLGRREQEQRIHTSAPCACQAPLLLLWVYTVELTRGTINMQQISFFDLAANRVKCLCKPRNVKMYGNFYLLRHDGASATATAELHHIPAQKWHRSFFHPQQRSRAKGQGGRGMKQNRASSLFRLPNKKKKVFVCSCDATVPDKSEETRGHKTTASAESPEPPEERRGGKGDEIN